MKKIFGWTAKHVFLPLTPFFIVAIFRFTYQGVDWAIFDPALLSFSMAMLCLLVTHSASNLRDPDEKDSIYYFFTSLMIIFLALSIGVSILEIQSQTNILIDLQNYNSSLKSGNSDSAFISQTQNEIIETSQRVMILRGITLVSSLGTVILVILFKMKYNLED